MRPRSNLTALLSGVVLLACLSGCASVPRAEGGRADPDRVGAIGPPVPRALRAGRRGNPFADDLAPVLKKTGDVLLDIATAILPEPSADAGIWTHGFDYSDSLTGFGQDGDEGTGGCIANSAVQWCPFFLAP